MRTKPSSAHPVATDSDRFSREDQDFVQVYEARGGDWVTTERLLSEHPPIGRIFGVELALQDGHLLVRGSSFFDCTSRYTYSYVDFYRKSETTWLKQQDLRVPGSVFGGYPLSTRNLIDLNLPHALLVNPGLFTESPAPGIAHVYEYLDDWRLERELAQREIPPWYNLVTTAALGDGRACVGMENVLFVYRMKPDGTWATDPSQVFDRSHAGIRAMSADGNRLAAAGDSTLRIYYFRD